MTLFWSNAYRLLWTSTVAASSAQGIERTTTAWVALQTGGGALAVGIVFAVRNLPSLLLGLTAGTIADRADRPRQLLAVAGGALALMAGFSWLLSQGNIRVWQAVAFSFAAGCIQVFDTPARQALVLDTVPREAGPRALALNALAQRFSVALGALAAGALIPLAGVARCYLLVAAAYGLMALLVAGLRAPHGSRRLVAPPPFAEALRGAARLMIDVPLVRTLMIAGIACEVLAFSHGSALPVFTRDVLASGAEGLGTLNAAGAVGGALAVLLLSLLPSRVGRQPVLGTIFVLYGLALIALAATRSVALAAAVMVVTGFCAGAFDVLQQTLIQLAVPEEQRGRAVGVWVLGLGSAPAGNLEMGALIAALGSSSALVINGSLTVAIAATMLARVPGYRWRLRARSALP